MEDRKEETFKQEEIELKIGKIEVKLYCSQNALNIVVEEPTVDLEALISIQNNQGSVKSIIWNNKKGLMDNSSYGD